MLVVQSNGGTRHYFALFIFSGNFLHVIVGVIMNRVGDAQDVVLGRDARATPLAVFHAAPKGAPASHTVRYKNIRLVNKLQVTALRLNKM